MLVSPITLLMFSGLAALSPAKAADFDKRLARVAECAWKRDPGATARFMVAGDPSRPVREYLVEGLVFATGDRCKLPKFFKVEELHAAVATRAITSERQMLVAAERERLPVTSLRRENLSTAPSSADVVFATCVRGRANKHVKQFLASAPDSETERAALSALSPAFVKCSNPSGGYRIHREALRAALSAAPASN
jgi:hypothetical protein